MEIIYQFPCALCVIFVGFLSCFIVCGAVLEVLVQPGFTQKLSHFLVEFHNLPPQQMAVLVSLFMCPVLLDDIGSVPMVHLHNHPVSLLAFLQRPYAAIFMHVPEFEFFR